MIDNKHIYEIDLTKIDFDMDYLRDWVLKKPELHTPNVYKFVYEANQDPYTSLLYQKYPCLATQIIVYRFPPKWTIGLHVDSNRLGALNMPVQNTENTETIFYEYVGEPVLELDPIKKWYNVKSKVIEVFRFNMISPVLINNSVSPHEVKNDTSDFRISISWSLSPEVTFEQAKAIFASYSN